MFKILGRIALILVIAGLISGSLYLLANQSIIAERQQGSGSQSAVAQAVGFQSNSAYSSGNNSSRISFQRGAGEHGFSGEVNLGRRLAGMLGEALMIGFITLLIVLIRKLFNRGLARAPVKITRG